MELKIEANPSNHDSSRVQNTLDMSTILPMLINRILGDKCENRTYNVRFFFNFIYSRLSIQVHILVYSVGACYLPSLLSTRSHHYLNIRDSRLMYQDEVRARITLSNMSANVYTRETSNLFPKETSMWDVGCSLFAQTLFSLHTG